MRLLVYFPAIFVDMMSPISREREREKKKGMSSENKLKLLSLHGCWFIHSDAVYGVRSEYQPQPFS